MNKPGQVGNSSTEMLASSRVAIVGLGLMGGSMAMALRGQCKLLSGYDINPRVIENAQARQVVDQASANPDEILPQAELIILAAPVKQILAMLGQLDRLHPQSAVVLDIGSTKRQVMEAMQSLPARFEPLGGHPICGKEESSLAYAEPGLYRGAPFVLCRLPRTTGRAIRLAEQVIEAIGAYPIYMEAEEHDRFIASTSHLPYLLANALVQATPREAQALIGPGFRSATRLAASYAPMMLDVLETNRDMLLPALHAFRETLGRMETDLKAGNSKEIEAFLQEVTRKHAELLQSNLPEVSR